MPLTPPSRAPPAACGTPPPSRRGTPRSRRSSPRRRSCAAPPRARAGAPLEDVERAPRLLALGVDAQLAEVAEAAKGGAQRDLAAAQWTRSGGGSAFAATRRRRRGLPALCAASWVAWLKSTPQHPAARRRATFAARFPLASAASRLALRRRSRRPPGRNDVRRRRPPPAAAAAGGGAVDPARPPRLLLCAASGERGLPQLATVGHVPEPHALLGGAKRGAGPARSASGHSDACTSQTHHASLAA